MLISIGVSEFCERKGVYWFLDVIKSYNTVKFKKDNEFQVWKFKRDKDQDSEGCTVICEDGNGKVLISQKVPSTDYEGVDFKWWYANDTAYLPSEH
jgi:hypothetical protein